MVKKSFLLVLTLLTTLCLWAQEKDPVVFSIGGKPVYKSEVEYAFKKGNETAEEKQSAKEFIDSYINFKLNVAEAIAEQLDTTASYKRQYSSYRLQVAQPYLQKANKEFEEEYTFKIYNRMLENVEINHVLFPFQNEEVVLPADTVETYKEAINAREKIIKEGFNIPEFTTTRSKTRYLPDAQLRNGYIGWVAPFMFPANVEDIIYSASAGEISMPIRSRKGYHIIQVLNRRPAVGSVEIEQVIFNFPRVPATQHQIDSVGKIAWQEYQNINSAKDFQSLCDLFSEVHQTGDKGCNFGTVGLDSNLPLDFTMAALDLEKPGEISKPVMSDYGFHIMRLVNKTPIPDFESIKNQLFLRITKSDKVQELNHERRDRLRAEFDVVIDNNAYNKLIEIANTTSPVDPTFTRLIENGKDILFNINNERAYSVKEFTKYIENRQKERIKDTQDIVVMQTEAINPYTLSTDMLNEYLDMFIDLLLRYYEDDTLEKRFPEFAKTINEFSEGLLYYEVQDKNIWTRAKNDTNGLSAYFNKNKSKYALASPQYKGVVIYANDQALLKQAESLYNKATNQETFIQKVKETINKDSVQIKIETGTWAKGENPFIDNKVFNGKEPAAYPGYTYFTVTGKSIHAPEEYTDVREEVELDYQEYLEKEWITYLKNKHLVELNNEVLNSIK